MSRAIPQVDARALRLMGIDMLDQFNVVDVLVKNEIRVSPLSANGSGSGLWMWRAAGPGNGIFDLFYGFDSPYHNDNNNGRMHVYKPWVGNSFSATGSEINYFFQGLLFRAFGVDVSSAFDFCGAWKAASRHGDLTPNCRYFVAEGHRELPSMWHQVYAAYCQHRTDEARMEQKRVLARGKIIQSANTILRRSGR